MGFFVASFFGFSEIIESLIEVLSGFSSYARLLVAILL